MKLSKKFIVIAAVPALALAASACTSAQAATTPSWFINGTVTITGVYSATTVPNAANNDSITVGAAVSLVLNEQITPITMETLVNGVVTSSRTTNFDSSPTGGGYESHAVVRDFYAFSQTGNPLDTALGPFTEAGGVANTYTVEAVAADGAVLATSKPVTFTAPGTAPKPAPAATIGITSVVFTHDQPTSTSPNYDYATISGQDALGTTEPAAIYTFNGSGQIIATNPVPAGSTFTLPPLVVTTVNTNYTYKLEAGSAISAPVTVFATYFTPTPSPAVQAWETSYGNAESALLTPVVNAVQADLAADTASGKVFPSTTAQRTDANNLWTDVRSADNGTFPAPPITITQQLVYWKGSIAYLYNTSIQPGLTGPGGYNSTYTNSMNITSALSDLSMSGVEW